MHTQFRIIPEGTKPLDLDTAAVNRALPSNMHMEEQAAGVYITVETPVEEDEDAQPRVQQELDRFFFLTCVKARPEMIRRRISVDFPQSYRIHGFLPEGLGPQNWSATLALQLRLWSAAVDIVDPPTQLLIFFQIIELSYPDSTDTNAYPKFHGNGFPPSERTEAKLLRHVVTHAGQATGKESQRYLEYLGLGHTMADRTNADWIRVISEKVKHVRGVAHDVIKAALSGSTSFD